MLRRGFKAEANAIALEVRSDLGLEPYSPLNPFALAEYLAIPVWSLGSMQQEIGQAIHHFTHAEPEAFSAITVFHGPQRTIVHNDAHGITRQRSNVAHELAHCLLGHSPMEALDSYGCRTLNPTIEEEAAWLSGTLLVTREAAVSIVRRRLQNIQAAELYGVSLKMMTYRINVTGARKPTRRL